MAEVTGISWTDSTFNAWIGCTEVSVGEKGACVGCYAREQAKRYGWAEWGNSPRHRTSEAYWRQPLTWDRKAAATGKQHFVFCCSLADVFDNQVEPPWRRDLFKLIRATPHLTWLLLTKRPQNIVKLFVEAMHLEPRPLDEAWPRNAAIGCTVVTQAETDRDIPHLLAAKAALSPAFAFLSMEPLMEAVTFRWAKWDDWSNTDGSRRAVVNEYDGLRMLDWIITGGETDQGKFKARPSDVEWFRSLRDQCQAAGVPFHMKQMTRKAPIPADLQIQDRPQ